MQVHGHEGVPQRRADVRRHHRRGRRRRWWRRRWGSASPTPRPARPRVSSTRRSSRSELPAELPLAPRVHRELRQQARSRTPMKTTAGECCVVDTCAGRTAFGVYNLFGRTGLPNPPTTAAVLVTLDYQSSYFERPSANQFDPGQWQFTVGAGGTVGCVGGRSQRPRGRGIPLQLQLWPAAGAATRRDRHPSPRRTGRAPWVLSANDTAVSIGDTAASPDDIVRPGGRAAAHVGPRVRSCSARCAIPRSRC